MIFSSEEIPNLLMSLGPGSPCSLYLGCSTGVSFGDGWCHWCFVHNTQPRTLLGNAYFCFSILQTNWFLDEWSWLIWGRSRGTLAGWGTGRGAPQMMLCPALEWAAWVNKLSKCWLYRCIFLQLSHFQQCFLKISWPTLQPIPTLIFRGYLMHSLVRPSHHKLQTIQSNPGINQPVCKLRNKQGLSKSNKQQSFDPKPSYRLKGWCCFWGWAALCGAGPTRVTPRSRS